MQERNVQDIYSGKTLLAKIVRANGDKGLQFYTTPSNPLQFGKLRHPSGYTIVPHVHRRRAQVIETIQEVLYVESGMVQVDLYDENEAFVQPTIYISTGDVIILIAGGHGFTFLEDSKLVYVKQGPYLGKKEDKKLL